MARWWLRATVVAPCAVVCLLASGGERNEVARAADAGGARPAPRAAVDAYLLGPTELVAGSRASYRVAAHWASSPERSGPLAGAQVALRLKSLPAEPKPGDAPAGGRTLRELGRAWTDREGNVDLRFQVPRVATGKYLLAVSIRSRRGATSRAHEVRISPGGRLLLTTDKKLYQPAQVIHIRALALRSIDLRPVVRRPITIQISDPKGNVVFSKEDRTSRFGVASLDFQLADEINLGHYTVAAWTSGAGASARSSRKVEVRHYVLPKFKVTVETERSYYRPGETVRGTVRCRYFFGKPVAGAHLAFESHSSLRGRTTHVQPALKTDAEGRADFELQLGGGEHAQVGELRIVATVTDTARHRERGDLSLPLTSQPLQIEVVPENHQAAPGVPNRVHVIAGYPDGQPAKQAVVRLMSPGQQPAEVQAKTDGLGVATLEVPVRAGSGALPVIVQARDARGERAQARVAIPVASRRAVLVRPVRSIVAPGEAVELELRAPPSRRPEEEQVYLDVVKAGQTLATLTARLRRGRARVRFQPDAHLFGLLELRAYRLKGDGERVGTSRVVYVDHPGELRIAVRADKTVYRPGARAHLRFSVTDSRTGDGVQAALGVLGVDEAVVAMGGLEPESSPKLFFTLASQATGGGARVRPGGRDLESWVAEPATQARDSALRTRAADVLLAAVRPVDAPVWETNPWRERRERWQSQAPALIQAALKFMEDHSAGRLTAKGWRFRSDLVPFMARAGAIERDQVRDPWERVVRPWHLRAVDPQFAFAPNAARLAPQKLSHIYQTLRGCWRGLRLPRERVPKLARKQWPLVLPQDLLQQLVRRKELKPGAVIDPWGQPYRIRRHPKRFVNPYYTGLVSRDVIYSVGPDRMPGTNDDVVPAGESVVLKDAVLGTDAADALGGLIGNAIGEAYGVGGLGLAGFGRGGGGVGAGTIGLGSLGTIGHGGGGMPARVRSKFPETLLWAPELVTDRSGRARLEVELADSITDWRIVTTGSTTNGLLGTHSATLRVFQDFFVDIDLPVALTQGDRVSVPVSVYNYLDKPQQVKLQLAREGWFTPAGPLEQTITLQPNEVGVRHFPIVAQKIGRQDLTVHATTSGGAADAVRRTCLVEPDGVERGLSLGGGLSGGGEARHVMQVPEDAIPGTARAQVTVYAGPMGQVLDGLEGMLRRPYGCFEQTSSTTYPNLLVLDYLRRTKQATPKVEEKARALVNEGYQRLIGFEVPGGGFSWFGNAPANRVLTAYGLMEFSDMARVHPVDPKLIARTQRWLAEQQQADGTWKPDSYAIDEGATNHFRKDVLRITAYIAGALRHSGYRGQALERAQRYVRAHAAQARDPYTLAVLASSLAGDDSGTARDVRRRLWAQRQRSDKGLYFPGPRATLTCGAGKSGKLEATALGALALLQSSDRQPETVKLVDTLLASKDAFGAWHSTQATILSLRALLKQHEVSRATPTGVVQVLVDGELRHHLRLRGGRDATHQLDLTPHVGAGRHEVALRFAGEGGSIQYHLGGRYWVSRGAAPLPAARGLAIRTRYDRQRARPGDPVRLAVEVQNRAPRAVDMPLVSLGLPPGFDLPPGALTGLVAAGKVDKVQRVGNRALLYLTQLGARKTLRFDLTLRGRYPLDVQARPSAVYEYYRPENRGESAAQRLEVL